jgi:hypothetical protein
MIGSPTTRKATKGTPRAATGFSAMVPMPPKAIGTRTGVETVHFSLTKIRGEK